MFVRSLTFSWFVFVPNSLTAQVADTTATVQLADLIISASRLEEDLSKSPITIEKLDTRAIYQSAAPSFYDALENVKGVQMLVPSVGFKVVNTRGFGNTTNVRFVQMIDGMDNQAWYTHCQYALPK